MHSVGQTPHLVPSGSVTSSHALHEREGSTTANLARSNHEGQEEARAGAARPDAVGGEDGWSPRPRRTLFAGTSAIRECSR